VLKVAFGAVGLRSAVLVAVPIPEENEVDTSAAVEQAVREADQQGIKGKMLTPYLLRRVAELTDGKSLQANVALLVNNAGVAAAIAAAMERQSRRRIGFLPRE
jgi:pseudouridine-5'-phosphate glycosidase